MMIRICAAVLLATSLTSPASGEERAPARAADGGEATEMTLAEAIFLGLRTSRNVQSAYLQRTVEKFDLRVAEDEFRPDVTVTAASEIARSTFDSTTTTETRTSSEAIGIEVTQRILTGAQFTFRWADTSFDSKRDNPFNTDSDSWRVTFEQPLLRGRGIDVATASRTQARIRERNNILSLRDTIERTVNSIIASYRDFYLATQEIEIAANSLARARDQYEINRLLIDARRMAEVELVQTEADIASREYNYEAAVNAADRARLNLLQILDIDKRTLIKPVAEGDVPEVNLDLDHLLEIAYANRVDYLQSLNDLESQRVDVLLAENNRLWDLSLSGGYESSDASSNLSGNADEKGWNVAATLSVPLYGDLSRQQVSLGAGVAMQQAELAHKDLVDEIELSVIDGIREVESAYKQLTLARRSTELTERKVEIEQEKLRAGRSSNFTLVSFQNDLVSTQINELSSLIGYLNALTALDALLGTTLDTWQIEFARERYQPRE